jgi:hypothetical protein
VLLVQPVLMVPTALTAQLALQVLTAQLVLMVSTALMP